MVRVYDAVFHRMHIAVAPEQWNILTSIPARYNDMNTYDGSTAANNGLTYGHSTASVDF